MCAWHLRVGQDIEIKELTWNRWLVNLASKKQGQTLSQKRERVLKLSCMEKEYSPSLISILHVMTHALCCTTNKTWLQIDANLSASHTETLGVLFCQGNESCLLFTTGPSDLRVKLYKCKLAQLICHAGKAERNGGTSEFRTKYYSLEFPVTLRQNEEKQQIP